MRGEKESGRAGEREKRRAGEYLRLKKIYPNEVSFRRGQKPIAKGKQPAASSKEPAA
jgi:hypothetical protein